ncbi:hypothetical protein HY484_04725 [Candidatus Woesearchaeota archaeon]|nr:hypothetical protein [Candidatus Woesearchaeota archaeon]
MYDCNQPIKSLPKRLQKYFIAEANYLLTELKRNRLEVVLIPAPRPMHHSHKIRAVQNSNPEWYSELYLATPHFRRDRSLSALERICNQADQSPKQCPKQYQYDAIYRHLIFERLSNGYLINGCRMPPHIHNV